MQSPKNEIAKTTELMKDLKSESFPDLNDTEFEKELARKVKDWEDSTKDYLKNTNKFDEHQSRLTRAKWHFKAYGGSKRSIMRDLNEYNKLQPNADTKFWKEKTYDITKKARKVDKENVINGLTAIRRNEQEAWEKEYDRQLLDWQLQEIQRLRSKFLVELEKWFEIIKQLKEVFDELNIEPGILWDLSAGKLSAQDVSILKKWADYLKNDENVRELCELMGRLRKEQQSHRRDIVNSTKQYRVIEPDIHSNEEIIGIKLGRDLENVIPQELSLLSDPDIALLFDLKYVENRLMCFSKQGYKSEIYDKNIQEEITVVDDEKMGPIIICVDTSGSMSGAPENIAKALTLSLSSKAVSQKRNCYLINFSTSIDTLNLTPPKGINDLIDFLKMSFHGGTDVAPALYEGIRMMSNEDYKKADLLVISDFVIHSISPDIVSLCQKQISEKNRFFALSIGSFGTQRVEEGIFDQSWTYDPVNGTISEINNIIEWISRK
ncbi:VWA domain-containing protein [Methanococcoides methylutens]|uniref:VWFA domain-containing protein n=1 Tax=Methanococcoides methylutens MM1 TaxID=1434104 RepID=A0A0E3X0R1_METMT|nr:VWA domain-containing protein [Methanococcoides methylutens]AKB85980.1 hypothetical protein MCMEM_1927 [Methanococcoides methylutens MM1]